jgi:hypothetical protein
VLIRGESIMVAGRGGLALGDCSVEVVALGQHPVVCLVLMLGDSPLCGGSDAEPGCRVTLR